MIADLVDGVVQPLERIADPLPGHFSGLASGRVHAEPDVEQAADDPVQQVFGAPRPIREHAADQVDEVVLAPFVRGVPDYGEDEMPAGGGDRAQRDRHRDGVVLVQSDQPGPVSHGPGHRLERIGGPVHAVRVPQPARHQRLHQLAGQLGGPIAEHLRRPPAGSPV